MSHSLRIDKGYVRGALNLECRFITVIGVIVFYILIFKSMCVCLIMHQYPLSILKIG